MGLLSKIAGIAKTASPIAPWAGMAASAFGAYQQQRESKSQAKRQMSFQERMSSTAHQREVRDLRAAGLNPILSATKGASSPGGAMGVPQNIAGSALTSALNTAHTLAQIKNINADANLKKTTEQALAIPGTAGEEARTLFEQAKAAGVKIPESIERILEFWFRPKFTPGTGKQQAEKSPREPHPRGKHFNKYGKKNRLQIEIN